jgi:hypothetical protein
MGPVTLDDGSAMKMRIGPGAACDGPVTRPLQTAQGAGHPKAFFLATKDAGERVGYPPIWKQFLKREKLPLLA